MVTIRIAEGTGTGPTTLAAFDAALASVGAAGYNHVRLSSVIPADATLTVTDDLTDLGTIGDRLHSVRATARTPPGSAGAAGLAWARTEAGHGLFYEASHIGDEAVSTVEADLDAGLEHGLAIRSWSAVEREIVISSVTPAEDVAQCAIVLAAYGDPDRPW